MINECNLVLLKLATATLGWQKGIRDVYGSNGSARADQAIASILAYSDRISVSSENMGGILFRWIPGSEIGRAHV